MKYHPVEQLFISTYIFLYENIIFLNHLKKYFIKI